MAAVSSRTSSSFSHLALGPHGDDVSSPLPHGGNVAAVVPFSWEEKPGVSKQPICSIEKKMKETSNSHATSSSSQEQALFLQFLMEDSKVLFPLPTPPARLHTIPPLSPTSFDAKAPKEINPSSINHSEQQRNYSRRQAKSMVRAKDDPFLMAIEACTKVKSTSELKGDAKASNNTNNNSTKLSPKALLSKLFENEEPVPPTPRKPAYNGHPAFIMSTSFQSKHHEKPISMARHQRSRSHGSSNNMSFGGCMGCRNAEDSDSIVRL